MDVSLRFKKFVKSRLAEIEDALAQDTIAKTPFTTEVANHLLSAGGKRFRPLLVVLASQLHPGVATNDEICRAAQVMELTHVASLYHDDVMDEAPTRRGVPAANLRWSNSIAIMVGDFLFSRASSIVATLGTEYVWWQAETFGRLVQGQIAEIRGAQDGIDPMQHYLDVIADKTGSLIALSTRYGGMVCGASATEIAALAAFGEEIGLVFQLSDDLLDIASDRSGKTPGTDLREGVLTLPTLYLMASTDPADAELQERLAAPIDDEDLVQDTLRKLRVHPVMEQARAEIQRRAEVARGYLAVLPDGDAKTALSLLCDQVVDRSI